MSTSLCRKICITPPKCICKERGLDFYSHCSIVAAARAMSWRRCVSLWKRKYFFWASKRGHKKSVVKLCLQHCSRTVQPKYLSVCSAFYGGLFPDHGRVAYNAGLLKDCFYKVGQFQLCIVSDSQPVSMFSYLKNLPLTIQRRVLSGVE